MSKLLKTYGAWFIAVFGLFGGFASIDKYPDSSRTAIYISLALAVVVLGWGSIFLSSRRRLIAIPTRDERPPLNTELGDAHEVFLSMHSGSVRRAQGDLLRTQRKLTVVLTHPDSVALREVSKIANCSPADLQNDVRSLSKALIGAGARVFWFDGPIQNSVIIANPNDPEKAWASVEVLIPFADPGQRPTLKASMRQHPGFYGCVRNGFDQLVKASDAAK